MSKGYAGVPTTRKAETANATKNTANNNLDHADINAEIRRSLDEAARASGLSDMELSRRTKIPPTTIRRMISGYISSPPYDKLLILANTLGVKLPGAGQIQAKFTLAELVAQGATLMSYPALPSESDVKKAESLLTALVLAKVVTVKAA